MVWAVGCGYVRVGYVSTYPPTHLPTHLPPIHSTPQHIVTSDPIPIYSLPVSHDAVFQSGVNPKFRRLFRLSFTTPYMLQLTPHDALIRKPKAENYNVRTTFSLFFFSLFFFKKKIKKQRSRINEYPLPVRSFVHSFIHSYIHPLSRLVDKS